MELFLRPELLAVCRMPSDAPWPFPVADGSLFSATLDGSELSVVCRQEAARRFQRAELDWRALTVLGPLEFSMVGVLSSLLAPVAEAGVGVFVLSTFETDHVLVKSEALEAAIGALRSAGHTVAFGPLD
jgi:uncharacterized protein